MRLELSTLIFCQLSSATRGLNSCQSFCISRRRSSSLLLQKDKCGVLDCCSDNSARIVTILQRGPNHIVAHKPPSVVCHHSGWTGSRSKQKRGEEPEIPMLQRVRDAVHDIDSRASDKAIPTRRVNLVHRLDRGASGALLLAFASHDEIEDQRQNSPTADLITAMASPEATKTYVALVRGEGILHGVDFKEMGWFEETRAIKDEKGEEKNATTWFRFVAGQPEISEDGIDQPRMCIVLARPEQGRWHQIRKHLSGLSHPILGDTTHGASKVNRQWKEQRNLPGERTCLHLARLQIPPTNAVPQGIDISCPIETDMLNMLRVYAPTVLEQSRGVFEEEGILIDPKDNYEIGQYKVLEELLQSTAKDDGDVEILMQGENYVIANKPPTVVAHHSSWTGRRSDPKRRSREPTPMLQRVRDATGRRVNLVHRLDRGASGCLLFSFAGNDNEEKSCPVTRALIDAMQSPGAIKTYIALSDGNGTWNEVDYRDKGWFTVDRPVKDEYGRIMENSVTEMRIISSCTLPQLSNGNDDKMEGRKATIILARPKSGRWHQVRQHLSGIGHAIIGDSSHGGSRTNRLWKKERKLPKERVCLHLCRIQLPATEFSPKLDVSCRLSKDMMDMLIEMPDLLKEARTILEEEGISI